MQTDRKRKKGNKTNAVEATFIELRIILPVTFGCIMTYITISLPSTNSPLDIYSHHQINVK